MDVVGGTQRVFLMVGVVVQGGHFYGVSDNVLVNGGRGKGGCDILGGLIIHQKRSNWKRLG